MNTKLRLAEEKVPPRIFISSIIREFEQFRDAAADAVRTTGGDPILVNENAPSAPFSSRNLCLDLVDSCDVFILLLGATAGWKTSSGKFVIEEEYDRAVQRKLPIFVFLQETIRDTDAEKFANRLSDYIHGHFRTTFRTPIDLRNAVSTALLAAPKHSRRPPNMDNFNQHLQNRSTFPNHATIRFVVQSERQEEAIDPLELDNPTFIQKILGLGHQQPNAIFNFRYSKDWKIANNALVITQDDHHSRHNAVQQTVVAMYPSGLISIETSILARNRTAHRDELGTSLTVLASDVRDTSGNIITFIDRIYGHVDPHHRHTRLLLNAVLPDLGYRTIVETPYPVGQGIPMRMTTSSTVVAFDQPYVITRNDLMQPDATIDRVVKLLQRRAQAT